MTRQPRNWGAFYRNQQDRARRALALGIHRPDLADRTPSDPPAVPADPDQDQDADQ